MSVDFVSAKVGWAWGGDSDLVLRTSDGGRRWVALRRLP